MAYSFNGSTQYLSSSAPLTAIPATMSAWVKRNNVASTVGCLYIGVPAANSRINVNLIVTSGDVSAIQAMINASDNTAATVASALTAGDLKNICATYTSNSQRDVFVGGSTATNTTSLTNTATYTGMEIGSRSIGGGRTYLNGEMSEVAVWSVALTADEANSLNKGFKPYRIRPQSLVFYAPLIRNITDRKGGLTITNNSTATVAVHPRVY